MRSGTMNFLYGVIVKGEIPCGYTWMPEIGQRKEKK